MNKRMKNRLKEIVWLLNSDQNILGVLKKSNEYLGNNKELAEKINENIRITQSLTNSGKWSG
jgi:hypothetical protein